MIGRRSVSSLPKKIMAWTLNAFQALTIIFAFIIILLVLYTLYEILWLKQKVRQNIILFNIKKWSLQKSYRVALLVSIEFAFILHMACYFFAYLIPANSESSPEYFLYFTITRPLTSTGSFILFNLSMMLYGFCLIDRYTRIQMIIPKSRAAYVFVFVHRIILAFGLLTILPSFISCAIGMYSAYNPEWIDPTSWNTRTQQVPQLFEILLPIVIIILEFFCNIRLLKTCLRGMQPVQIIVSTNPPPPINVSSSSSTTPPLTSSSLGSSTSPVEEVTATTTNNYKAEEYKRLRRKMLLLIMFLVVLDLITFFLEVAGGTRLLPADETLTMSMSLSGVHFLVSFSLLDLFLHELKRIKSLPLNGPVHKRRAPAARDRERYISPTFRSSDTSQFPLDLFESVETGISRTGGGEVEHNLQTYSSFSRKTQSSISCEK